MQLQQKFPSFSPIVSEPGPVSLRAARGVMWKAQRRRTVNSACGALKKQAGEEREEDKGEGEHMVPCPREHTAPFLPRFFLAFSAVEKRRRGGRFSSFFFKRRSMRGERRRPQRAAQAQTQRAQTLRRGREKVTVNVSSHPVLSSSAGFGRSAAAPL